MVVTINNNITENNRTTAFEWTAAWAIGGGGAKMHFTDTKSSP